MSDNKSVKLNHILRELGSFAVAFSGGVDSSFLLHRAHSIRKSSIIALTVRTPYIPSREIDETIDFTKTFNIKHKIVDLSFPDAVRTNPIERCYLCKKTLFTELMKVADKAGYKSIIDGTNADDSMDFRPGMQALRELGIRSPLMESGLGKKDIRILSKKEGLFVWDKPAMACLLTRIPYDTEVREETLRMVEQAENILFDMGYPGTRVRIHGDVARIECMPGYIQNIIHSPDREAIITSLKKIGFRFVSLDLEGYRTGRSNPEK